MSRSAYAPLVDTYEDVGHVGLVCSRQTVIHATNGLQSGIVCASLDAWKADPAWRGARRIVPAGHQILTLQIPKHLEVETSDDVLWTILETLNWDTM